MCRVHQEATRLGQNGMRGRVHREVLDGTGDGNKAWRTAQQRKQPCVRPAHSERGPVDREGSGIPQNGGNGPPTVETGVLLIGRGVAYRKTEETDLLRSKQGSCDREGCGVPQNRQNRPPTVETGVLFIGRGVAYRKTGLHGILFISTVNPLQPPRATVHPPSTSSSLHL